MSWLWLLPALFLLFDALKMRARRRALPVLSVTDEPAEPEHELLTAQGVEVDEETRRAASAFARRERLAVLDLVPGDLPALRAWTFLQLVDPAMYRADRLGPGVSLGHAVLVDRQVLDRAGIEAGAPRDALGLARAVTQAKRFASGRTGIAVAPRLRASSEPRGRRMELLRALTPRGAMLVLVGTPLLFAVLALGAATGSVAGLVMLGVFHLQPLVAFAGGGLGSRGAFAASLLRTPLEVARWLALVFERSAPVDPALIAARRAEYDELLAGGLDRFFEPRRDSCPVCAGTKLRREVEVGDLLQGKPGRFRLDACERCGHVFQNPRLSLEGLDFYYKDFYDGLGAESTDRLFGSTARSYEARARIVPDEAPVSRWLDVGGGHGHFCCAAREIRRETKFDALDLSESIDDAVRRGWVDEGFRGLFPDLAPTMAGRYDVVSMSHYLEHTRDPAVEIDAAREALAPRGYLVVEVPDPECPMRVLLGRFWLPWFQPQHQHLLSVSNLEKILREKGFEPLLWHRAEAHQTVDFLAAVILFMNAVLPAVDVPWRPARGAPARALRNAAFMLAIPALLAGHLLDVVAGRVIARRGGSNTYRVLAQKGA